MGKHIHIHVGGRTKDASNAYLEPIDRKLLEAVAMCDKVAEDYATDVEGKQKARKLKGQIQSLRNTF